MLKTKSRYYASLPAGNEAVSQRDTNAPESQFCAECAMLPGAVPAQKVSKLHEPGCYS